ncbi:PAS domain S-box-containing protein/diguanylate cyclase (GGDEF) domain-containing protein [Sulfurivirga caldicuralii]|uniref:PAS domain S-box-containing protein/diguanylate cyclase (GGDEF) domain-containing protein n=1 Tax=Sulfurivirga caldicuralii TaxID=364032 RepID=A0A1N6DJ62_9GAMM|nr:EAL domain-containing protein [Sulfurivirga caldicuralii]SIN70767.1 PAS domain S-box-containing protein/diguanylate cyclase (GGDEF) domain-containing protein [Sulfurivirga caldicuralii]
MHPLNWHSIRFKLLAALLVSLAVVLSGFYAYQHRHAETLLRQEIEQTQLELAERLSDLLQATMETHARQVELLSNLSLLADTTVPAQRKRRILERAKSVDKTIAWIGFTDTAGNILVGTEGLLEGKNVAHRDWFIKGIRGLHFGNVHDAFLLAKIMPKPKWDDLPLRLVDISAPLRTEKGEVVGVLCMHLGWDFAFAARKRVLEEIRDLNNAYELMVLTPDGHLLMGTENLPSKAMTFASLPGFQQVRDKEAWHGIVTWPDTHQPYLTTFINAVANQLPGLDWIIAVREPTEVAFAPARDLAEKTLWAFLIALTVISATMFGLVEYFFRPIEALTREAERINEGDRNVKLPTFDRHDEVGVLSRALSRLIDNLEQQLHQLQAQQRELRIYAQIFECAPVAIMILDEDTHIVTVNPAFEQITGHTAEQIRGKTPRILASGRHDKPFYENFWKTLLEKGQVSTIIYNRRANGEIYPERLIAAVLRDDKGGIMGYLGIFTDISEEEQARQEIERLSRMDLLTNLHNRHTFLDLLQQAMENKQSLWLLFVDLDHFKTINDTLGHPIGDAILRLVGHRIKAALPEGAFAGRYGGDEFLICLPGDLAVEETARAVAASIKKPYRLNDIELTVGVSIGIAHHPQHAENWNDLITYADAAMLSIKHKVRDWDWKMFDAKLHQQLKQRDYLIGALKDALHKNAFQLAWQPKVSRNSHEWRSFEVLLRWQHKGEWISPARFIPLAEEIGIIDQIDEWVITHALQTWQQWQAHGWTEGCSFALNLSAATLRSPKAIERLENMLGETGVSPVQVTIEITETMLMEESDSVQHAIARLEALGCSLSLDDFGTGYANLEQISRLPLDQIKIDLRFVQGMQQSRKDRLIVEQITQFAHALQMTTVAEGVETAEQAAELEAIGVDLLQGYYFSKPLLSEALEAHFRAAPTQAL